MLGVQRVPDSRLDGLCSVGLGLHLIAKVSDGECTQRALESEQVGTQDRRLGRHRACGTRCRVGAAGSDPAPGRPVYAARRQLRCEAKSKSVSQPIGRRKFLTHSGAAVISGALAGCRAGWLATAPRSAPPSLQLMPLRATPDRITAITVCTRPFRAQGPRLDVEQLLGKTVVHNYGHGGSGWSLSWGSSALAVEKALATGERQIAVIGCGALGITSALLLQRAGARVTIYAKELPPNVRSSLATGLWTPDSRICFDAARHAVVQANVGEHGTALVRDLPDAARSAGRSGRVHRRVLRLRCAQHAAARCARRRCAAEIRRAAARVAAPICCRSTELLRARHPPVGHALSAPQHADDVQPDAPMHGCCMADFHSNGGQIQIDEFHSPSDFVRVREKTLINATGYGARALFNDQSVIPVRGQLARMIPQPQINYGLIYQGVAFVPAPRRSGLPDDRRERLLRLQRRHHGARPRRSRARRQHHR